MPNLKRLPRGFTLIELVIVIVILGILAATAVPKFVDLGRDARVTAITGTLSAMRAANAMIYGRAVLENKVGLVGSGQNCPFVVVAGKKVCLQYGYVSGAQGFTDAVQFGSNIDYASFAVGEPKVFYIKGAPNEANCSVGYEAAQSATEAPTYTLKTDGC